MNELEKVIDAFRHHNEFQSKDYEVKMRRLGPNDWPEVWQILERRDPDKHKIIWVEPTQFGGNESFFTPWSGHSVDILNVYAHEMGYRRPFKKAELKIMGNAPAYLPCWGSQLLYGTEKYRLRDRGKSYREVIFGTENNSQWVN